MILKTNSFYVYSFYRFKYLNEIKKLKILLDRFFLDKEIKGTILIATEGVNASIAGKLEDLEETTRYIKKILKIRKFEIKINQVEFLPFNRMKVRIKNEIVSLGQGSIDVEKLKARSVNPDEWNKILMDKNTYVIDVRNNFEISIGKFDKAINPDTESFRQFPAAMKKLSINKTNKIAMYCTGGIRCEKASAFLKLQGYKNIVQLNGGIINYLEKSNIKNNKLFWKGECFVFDDRVAINKLLKKGKYKQCYGCRQPLSNSDTLSKHYKPGVHCPYCINKRSDTQKKNSETRQNQIKQAEENNKDHPFKKIYS